MKLGLLGPIGTFSDVARIKYEEKTKEQYELIYYPNFNQIFKNYDNLDLIIVPVENSLDGHIAQTLDEILERDISIIDEIIVDVSFSLLSNAKRLEDIEVLNVQFKAKGQCVEFINKLDCKINVTESNMESYELLKNNDKAASIVPSHKYDESYNLAIKDVTDSSNDKTKFFVLSHKKNTSGNKCYFCFEMIYNDRPGLLCDILKCLNEEKFNLAFILSRPTKKELGKYNFFAEINEIKDLDLLKRTFKRIEELKLARVKVLGIY